MISRNECCANMMGDSSSSSSSSSCSDNCRIPSLMQLSFEVLQKNLHRYDHAYKLHIISTCQHVSSTEYYDYFIKYVEDRYAFFLDRFGVDVLSQSIREDDLSRMQRLLDERILLENRLRQAKGEIIPSNICDSTSIQTINDGENPKKIDGYFTFSQLLQGVIWPPNIDPTKREQLLSDTEFYSVFGMSKLEFRALDKFKQIQLKKEKKLF